MNGFGLLPAQASEYARHTDLLFLAMLALCGLVLTLLLGFIVAFCVRYRHTASTVDPPLSLRQQRWLEISWTALPLLIFLGFYVVGARLYVEAMVPEPAPLELYIVAEQWMWKIQYPDGTRTINDIHLPVNRPVRLLLTSQDVIHSFYLPAFRIKHDVLPERYSAITLTPSVIGTYPLRCAEFCGLDHARMGGRVFVTDEQDYVAWLQQGERHTSLARQGETLFIRHGCSGCHNGHSAVHAPSLNGLWGQRIYLQTGETVIVDETYVQDSILQPDRQIAAGYRNEMPSFTGLITPEEMLKLIAYIKSLQARKDPAP